MLQITENLLKIQESNPYNLRILSNPFSPTNIEKLRSYRKPGDDPIRVNILLVNSQNAAEGCLYIVETGIFAKL